MNDKEQFYNDFYEELEKAMEPSGAHLSQMDILKNNSAMKGITVKFDNVDLAPTIYPDFYFNDWKEGHPMRDIVSGISTDLIKAGPDMSKLDIDSIRPDNAVTHLRAAIVGYDNNREWLQSVPHERTADLAVYAKWDFGDGFVAKVNDYLLATMQLTKEEALKIAKSNTAAQADLQSMSSVMTKIMIDGGMDGTMAQIAMEGMAYSPLYVLSNKECVEGAAVIADTKTMRDIREAIGEDFYILPSSIHEVLLLPKSECDNKDVDDLCDMVQSINGAEVPLQDQLSDNVYEFDGKGIKLAGENSLTQEHNITDSVTHRRSR